MGMEIAKLYLSLGFISTMVGREERPQCVLYLKVLASKSLKPSQLIKTAPLFSYAQLASCKVSFQAPPGKKPHTIAEK